MSVSTATETQAGILRLVDSRQTDLKLDDLTRFLADLKDLHEACVWLAQPSHVRLLNMGGFVARARVPALVIRDIRIGSLWLEILQEAGGPAGVGAAIWLMARVLRQGPGKLYEWAGVLPRAQTEWVRQRADLAQERARLREAKEYLDQENEVLTRAHAGYINIIEQRPELDVSVTDENGQELPEPPSVFADEEERGRSE